MLAKRVKYIRNYSGERILPMFPIARCTMGSLSVCVSGCQEEGFCKKRERVSVWQRMTKHKNYHRRNRGEALPEVRQHRHHHRHRNQKNRLRPPRIRRNRCRSIGV